jgi:membrane fusion protein, multidrug efflux system
MKRIYFVLPALAALISCGGEAPKRVEAQDAPPVAVSAVLAQAKEWPSGYEATGTVRARTSAGISSRIMGYVQQVSVQAGDRVRQGQLLITIDSSDLEPNVRRAEAGRTEAQSAFPEADSAVAAAKANLDLAQTTFKRIENLASKNSISRQEFDEASARLKAAQANYEMARARRTQLDSKLAQADQEVRSASVMRDYARITAPFAGVVTAKSVEPGNLATPGAPLLTIEKEDGFRLEASVDESRLASVKAGQSVRISIDSIGEDLAARVGEVVPSVDPGSRTYIVKIDLPANPKMRSGMFGRALFQTGSRSAVTAPASALVERGQLQAVYVLEDGRARTRLVTVGARSKDAVEILSGLSAGESLVAVIPPGLQDGARLEVRK